MRWTDCCGSFTLRLDTLGLSAFVLNEHPIHQLLRCYLLPATNVCTQRGYGGCRIFCSGVGSVKSAHVFPLIYTV